MDTKITGLIQETLKCLSKEDKSMSRPETRGAVKDGDYHSQYVDAQQSGDHGS